MTSIQASRSSLTGQWIFISYATRIHLRLRTGSEPKSGSGLAAKERKERRENEVTHGHALDQAHLAGEAKHRLDFALTASLCALCVLCGYSKLLFLGLNERIWRPASPMISRRRLQAFTPR